MNEAKLRAALQRINNATVNVEAVFQRAKAEVIAELLPALADAYAAMGEAAPPTKQPTPTNPPAPAKPSLRHRRS